MIKCATCKIVVNLNVARFKAFDEFYLTNVIFKKPEKTSDNKKSFTSYAKAP